MPSSTRMMNNGTIKQNHINSKTPSIRQKSLLKTSLWSPTGITMSNNFEAVALQCARKLENNEEVVDEYQQNHNRFTKPLTFLSRQQYQSSPHMIMNNTPQSSEIKIIPVDLSSKEMPKYSMKEEQLIQMTKVSIMPQSIPAFQSFSMITKPMDSGRRNYQNKSQQHGKEQSASTGRKTMLVYSNQRNNFPVHKVTRGSFSDIQSIKTLEDDVMKVSLLDNDLDAMDVQETLTLNSTHQSKSKERIINATVINRGTTVKARVDISPPVFGQVIYQSSPTKTKVSGLQIQQPQSSVKGKQVFMQKPMKLSSQQTDSLTTPNKPGRQSDIQIDITLDLTERDLDRVPPLILQTETLPTIIDLRKNQLIELPSQLFQIPTLKQLRLDQNLLSNLPLSLQEPHKCRLQVLTVSHNKLKQLPDWVSCHARQTLERLDLSFNPEFNMIHESLCNLEFLKVLLIQGNNVTSLPCYITRLCKIEEFGLEWWQYITTDEHSLGKKAELGFIRDDTIITNRQILRQIFEGFKLVNQFKQGVKRIHFAEFFRQYKRTYVIDKRDKEHNCRIQALFHLVCHFGHIHLIDQLLRNPQSDQTINLNKAELPQGQTSLQLALHIAPNEEFLMNILQNLQLDQAPKTFANFEVYQQRPNEELPLQRQCSLLHPVMIALKRKMLPIVSEIIRLMRDDAQKSKQDCLLLDFKDENRNTLFHHIFAYVQEDDLRDGAIALCKELITLQQNSKQKDTLNIQIKLNETNKQGMTPLDLAIELRINEAVQFALDSNTSLQNAKDFHFNPNYNHNQRNLTPLHRAVQSNNHLALMMLLKTKSCNALMRDKDFKKARDYCQRMLIMQKMLRIAEIMQIVTLQCNFKDIVKRFSPAGMLHIMMKAQFIQKRESLLIKNSATKRSQSNIYSGSKSKTLKRSASENKDYNQHQNFKSVNMFTLDLVGSDTTSKRMPMKIERPMPIDKLMNLPYNKSVIDNRGAQDFQTYNEIQTQSQEQLFSQASQEKTKVHNLKPPKNSSHVKKVSNVKPNMAQPNPHIHSVDKTSPGFIEDDVILSGEKQNKKSSNKKFNSKKKQNTQEKMQNGQVSNFDTFIYDEADASEESPTAFPSNKFQYVMTVNNSKLARRPYYKKLIKNTFETKFCEIMEPQKKASDFAKKYAILYSVYMQGIQSKDKKKIKHAREFFNILNQEMKDPHEGLVLLPLQNEITYLHEKLQTDYMSTYANVSRIKSSEGKQITLKKIKESAPSPILRMPIIQNTDKSIQEPSILKGSIFGPYSSRSRAGTQNGNGSGLVLMKSLRQSVSLKSLFISINQQTQNKEPQIKAKAITSRKHHFQQPKNSSANVSHSLITRVLDRSIDDQAQNIPGLLQRSPTSPRGDSGQVAQKEYLNRPFQLQFPQTKESTNEIQNICTDMNSPIPPPSSSEYSMRSHPKRKLTTQIIDSSVRTVQINIDKRTPMDFIFSDENSIGEHLKTRHSKIQPPNIPLDLCNDEDDFSPMCFFDQPIVPNVPMQKQIPTTTPTSLHRRYNNLAKAVVSYHQKPQQLRQYEARSKIQQVKNNNKSSNTQLSQRSISSNQQQSIIIGQNHGSSTTRQPKIYQKSTMIRQNHSQVQIVPQSIRVNLAKQQKLQLEENYYKSAKTKNFYLNNQQNPGS